MKTICFTTLIVLTILVFSSCEQTAKSENSAMSEHQPDVSAQATFVELGSVNCVPCKMMQPVMEEIKKEYSNRVKVIFYDVWTEEGAPFGETYKIRVIPTQVFLDKNGKEFFRHEGFFAKDDIVKVLIKQGIK